MIADKARPRIGFLAPFRSAGLIARGVEQNRGRLLKTKGEGDSTLTVFRRASDAVACAAHLRAALAAVDWHGELDEAVSGPRTLITLYPDCVVVERAPGGAQGIPWEWVLELSGWAPVAENR